MSDVWMLRTGILIAGVLLIAAIYFFGRPRKAGQGRRVEGREGVRVEPTIGAQLEAELAAHAGDGADGIVQSEMDLDRGIGASSSSDLGRRASEDFEKIVTLYIAARAGETLRGPDIVVAAEKAGLVYGHMTIPRRRPPLRASGMVIRRWPNASRCTWARSNSPTGITN